MEYATPSSGDNFTPRADGIHEIRIYQLNPYDTTAVLWFSNTPDVVYGSDLMIFDGLTEEQFEDEAFLKFWVNSLCVAQESMRPMDRTKFFLEEDNMVFTIGFAGVKDGEE